MAGLMNDASGAAHSTDFDGSTTLRPMGKKRTRPPDLREACILEALAIVDSSGVEELSLREVARRLGVSHQAPYKHFPSRDHILAEIVARAFDSFARYLDEQPQTEDAGKDLMTMARAYLRYAKTHPLQYRLMFGTPLPDTQEHPRMMEKARHAFSVLTDCLRRRSSASESPDPEAEVLLDALFIWSALHGLSGISSGRTLQELGIPPSVVDNVERHLLLRIGSALDNEGEPPPQH